MKGFEAIEIKKVLLQPPNVPVINDSTKPTILYITRLRFFFVRGVSGLWRMMIISLLQRRHSVDMNFFIKV